MDDKELSRRSFLRMVPAAVGGIVTLGTIPQALSAPVPAVGPRVRVPNPYVAADSKPLLVCVEGTDIQRMLKKGLDVLGGLGKLISYNQDVFIKPNCNFADPYPAISSVACVRAVVCEAVAVTDGNVRVGDQGYQPDTAVYGHMNLEHPVTSAGGSLEHLEATYDVRASHWNPGVPDHKVYTQVYDASVLLNLCSLKRHFAANMSCSLKNNVGTVAGPNAAATRAYLHAIYSELDDAPFQREVAEIAGLVNPDLNIVDARAILTVNGPFANQGVVEHADKLIICGDMVATDAYCSQLLAAHDETFDPGVLAPLLQHAETIGLGTSELGNVVIIEATES
ncbi:MAG TPA: DUF362 domain-containing protein [Acidobacteriota bacterium]|nr:DUF362 domain-containing protein [Acidobacteriota bacterium]